MPFPLAAAIIGSSVLGAFASKKAADKVSQSSDATTAEARRQFDLTREDYAPYREVGAEAIGRLGSIYDPGGPDYSSFYKSPGYEFVRSEGVRDIGNYYSAKGGGGNALKALADYQTGLASREFGNYFNREATLAGIGNAGTAGSAQAGTNMVNQIGQANYLAGNARASGVTGVANSVNAGLGNYLYGRGMGLFDPRKPLTPGQVATGYRR